MMIKPFIILSLIGFVNSMMSHPPQENSEELEKRNGFKSIRLANSIDSVAGASFKKEFMEKDEFPAKLYTVKNESLMSIGEVKVYSITLKTYKDLVYEIEVNTDKDQRLMRGMEKALGKAVYNVRTKAYHWRSQSLSLTFFGNKNSLTLIYKSYPVFKMMYADRGKKIDDIADDF
jgi:hypothetical protein